MTNPEDKPIWQIAKELGESIPPEERAKMPQYHKRPYEVIGALRVENDRLKQELSLAQTGHYEWMAPTGLKMVQDIPSEIAQLKAENARLAEELQAQQIASLSCSAALRSETRHLAAACKAVLEACTAKGVDEFTQHKLIHESWTKCTEALKRPAARVALAELAFMESALADFYADDGNSGGFSGNTSAAVLQLEAAREAT